jgi:two-component system phosphate regulon response regulator PhoB
MSHILLVEDDEILGETLFERIEKEGHKVHWAQTRGEAEDILSSKSLDLLILDVGLPDGSGFELAEKIKAINDTPIIFLTAQATAEDRLKGFELGAEEFIPKPFHLKELLMRVKHVLKDHVSQRRLMIQGVEIDFDARSVTAPGGETYFLGQKEYDVLWMLVERSPVTISRDEFLDHAWKDSANPSHRTVDNLIVNLRQALGPAGDRIRSVRGVGYQWVFKGEKDGE